MRFIDKTIPNKDREKTDHEILVDDCIPEAVDNTNRALVAKGYTASFRPPHGVVTSIFMNEMNRVTHSKGLRVLSKKEILRLKEDGGHV